jgi:lysyl-tRNA synthetase class 2
VHDFPASQAALARLRVESDGTLVAERFEVYLGPVEIANGFHELLDAGEQRRRFERDLAQRRAQGLGLPPIDERLLAALEHGLPECSGVALGFDRLVMVAAGANSLAEVTAFGSDALAD